jgi:hypothetical protein
MNKRLEYANTSQINLYQNKSYRALVKTELSNEDSYNFARSHLICPENWECLTYRAILRCW